MNFSYWEQKHFLHFDCMIVGSGITGLSTAISLKEKAPGLRVAVLERGILPTGASTKNAGFACFGSLTEILDDLENMSETECLQLIEKRWKGLLKLRNRLGEAEIGFENCGGYELIEKEQAHYLERMEDINKLLRPIFGKNIFERCDEKIDAFGFSKKNIQHLIYNSLEGSVDTGKMMKTLLKKASGLGVQVINGAEVTGWEEKENRVWVQCKNGMAFSTEKLGICSNAFSKQLLPHLDIRPGRGQVLVTKPMEKIPFEGIFHYDLGYYYFRKIDNRIILGGGRNKDFETENTTEFGINPLIKNDLKEKLKTIVAPALNPEIDYYWSGIMAFGPNKTTITGRYDNNVAYALRLGGIGVAIGSLMGDELAEIIAESIEVA